MPAPQLFAQGSADTIKNDSDYVINLKNDTIRCEIGSKFFSGKPKYKTQDGRNVQIATDSIKEYYLSKDSSVFTSQSLPGSNKPVFIRRIEHGKINLYEMTIQTTSYTNPPSGFSVRVNISYVYTYWFASKGNGPLQLIKYDGIGRKYTVNSSRKKRQKALMDMFSDDQNALNDFTNALKKDEYTFELIRNYIKAYNYGHLEASISSE